MTAKPEAGQTPNCDKCGDEITTGFMAFFCPHGSSCEFWPKDSGLDVQLLAYQHWEAEMKTWLAKAAPAMIERDQRKAAAMQDDKPPSAGRADASDGSQLNSAPAAAPAYVPHITKYGEKSQAPFLTAEQTGLATSGPAGGMPEEPAIEDGEVALADMLEYCDKLRARVEQLQERVRELEVALETIRDESFSGHSYDIATAALATRGKKEKP